MDDILQIINDILQDILIKMTENSGSYIGEAKLIAGVGALVLSIFTFFKIMKGNLDEPLENFSIRLFLVALGITYYGTFLSFMNAPLNVMTVSIKNEVLSNDTNTKDFFKSYDVTKNNNSGFSKNEQEDAEINRLLNEADLVSENSSDEDSLSNTFMNLWNGNYKDDIQVWIMESIYSLLHFLGVVAIVVINIIRTFFLIVLSIFGIFVIAFSMYPGLEGSFYQWVQKYINVYLWLPISYILQGLISQIFSAIKLDTSSSLFEISSQDALNAGNNYILALLGICSIVSFAAVPTLSSWLINAATSAAGSKVKGKTMDASKAAKKIITKK